jgi:predicted nucleic acid-binding protein
VNYLLDTNVACEPTKRRPDAKVIHWLAKHGRTSFMSTVTVGEIRRGIERMAAGERKDSYRAWLIHLCAVKKGFIHSFDRSTAHIWGQLKAKWDAAGISVPILDSQIAATAVRRQLVIVTRNTADFRAAGVKALNPFE